MAYIHGGPSETGSTNDREKVQVIIHRQKSKNSSSISFKLNSSM